MRHGDRCDSGAHSANGHRVRWRASTESSITREGWVRADFSLTIGYADDVKQAREIMSQIASADPRVLNNPPFEVVVDELGDNSVRLLIFPYVTPDNYRAVRNAMRGQTKAAISRSGHRLRVARTKRALPHSHTGQTARRAH
jgi:small-conductance mechanosensitive channel